MHQDDGPLVVLTGPLGLGVLFGPAFSARFVRVEDTRLLHTTGEQQLSDALAPCCTGGGSSQEHRVHCGHVTHAPISFR